jgi:biotin carboxylase
MTSQQQYQLDSEYRNRQMANAEQARLAQEAQANEVKHNMFGTFVSKVQQFVNHYRQQQTAQEPPMVERRDNQNLPATS